ncbi:MAG: Gfo/Idh/MocA family oxidoreductase [Candidatus Alcyoniella australis]|nr:Gfo/Idh/MocA family oxidoreductase [Candidatus Alcyoniella australis]
MHEPPRWGILGTAEIAESTIRAIKAGTSSELRAIASRDLSRAEHWAQRHSIALAFGSYQELLASGEVDLVYVPLPNSLHAQWTIQALESGHHVLCEKPLAIDAAQAERIAQTAARCDRHVAEGFMYRLHPQWQRVRELIADNAVGRLSSLYSRFTFMLDDPTANPASSKLAGGALMDVGCYCVNFSRMIAGCEPLRVSAFERRNEVDLLMLGQLEFPHGLLAQFETSIDNYERHGAQIAGTRGSIELESPWIPGDEPATIVLRREGFAPERIIIEPADSYKLQVEHFVEVCQGQEQPRWPIDDSVANMHVIDALLRSAREQRTIKV